MLRSGSRRLLDTHRWTALALLLGRAGALGAEAVPVGGGSCASEPPREKDVVKLFAQAPLVEKESAGRPLPTNDWWTSLLRDPPFPGKMWAYPMTVSADAGGVILWYPKGWSANGVELEMGPPLRVEGLEGGPPKPGGDLVVFDFEYEKWPDGWEVDGTAFGRAPMRPAQHGMKGVTGGRYACSFNGGDGGLGTLLSPPFTIERDYVHLLVAGGDDGARLGVGLEVDGKRLHTALGRRSNDLEWKRWDVRQVRGRKARVRLVDGSRGGWGFIAADQVMQSDSADAPSGGVFSHASTVRWGDWSVVMRMHAGPGRRADVTFGRGMPFVWIECSGVDLRVPLDADRILDLAGGEARLPVRGDSLVIERAGRPFALFAPERTRFARSGGGLDIVFDGRARYLVVGSLPDMKSAETFRRHAYAVPRDTRFDWQYDRAAGEVRTTWTVEAEALRGTRRDVLQGWIPHHWRTTRHDMKFLGPEFASQRGRMRLAAGTSFKIAWPFRGVLPALPAPEGGAAGPNPYDPKHMADYVARWTADIVARPAGKRWRSDTYWGAKDFMKIAQHLAIARETGHPASGRLHDMLAECLSDWFTYTPGEQARYFARYPAPWKGLVGFNPSYGSGAFTDCHFHHGYFALAAALLARDDPGWGKRFGGIARLVARQYANWDRGDGDFPYLRTFDTWSGHSYAAGSSNRHDGNNQESSSEAMQSWAGLVLLGSALGDEGMVSCGAMGYAIEAEAVREYWNDYFGWKLGEGAANFPPQYRSRHSIVSVLRDRDIGYWTWFSGKPIHIYGIQWLPAWTSLQYLGRDPGFVTWQAERMLVAEGKGDPATYSSLGADWGNVALGHALFGDPGEVCRILDQARAKGDALAGWKHAGVTYYLAHAYRALGAPAWDCHVDLATGSVFRDARGRLTVVAWDPSTRGRAATAYRSGRPVGRVTVPAGALMRFPLAARGGD